MSNELPVEVAAEKSEPKSKHRRFAKNYLIYPRLQIYLSLVYLLFFFYGCLITFGLLYWTISDTAFSLAMNDQLLLQGLFEKFIKDYGLWLIAAVFGFAALAVGLGIILTHKIGGPIFVIRRQISELRAGNYSTRIQLRPEDYLKEVMDDLHHLAKRLEEK